MTLQPYLKDRPCPKCGEKGALTQYLPKPYFPYWASCEGASRDHVKHLHRWCPNCHYEWCEALAEPTAETPENDKKAKVSLKHKLVIEWESVRQVAAIPKPGEPGQEEYEDMVVDGARNLVWDLIDQGCWNVKVAVSSKGLAEQVALDD